MADETAETGTGTPEIPDHVREVIERWVREAMRETWLVRVRYVAEVSLDGEHWEPFVEVEANAGVPFVGVRETFVGLHHSVSKTGEVVAHHA